MDHQFRIAVCALSDGGDEVDLTQDIRLLKPALLYGDHVTLYSPGATMLTIIRRSLDQSGEGCSESELQWIEQNLAYESEVPEMVSQLRRLEQLRLKPDPTPDEQRQIAEYARFLEYAGKEMEQTFVPGELALLGAAGYPELELASKAGLLTIDPIIQEADTFLPGEQLSRITIEQFWNRVGTVLSDPSQYPLFDDYVAEVARVGTQEGLFATHSRAEKHGVQVGLAGRFMNDLPAFERASVGEIIDIRHELERPLMRFRTAIWELGQEVQYSPFEPDFGLEVAELARIKIEPAVLEIEEHVQSNTYLRQLVGKVFDDALSLVGGAIAIGVGSLTNVVNALGTAAIPAVHAGIAAERERRKEQTKNEGHEMFMLYQTNQLLLRRR
jgi:hypothetical protein